MRAETPEKWRGCEKAMPRLKDAVSWEPLREWSLSNVYRITLRSGGTMIAKWSGGRMVGEVDFYNGVLAPLRIERPEIYASHRDDRGSFYIMEDLGGDTLEAKPFPAYFVMAARQLAIIHTAASAGIREGNLPEETFNRYYRGADHFLDCLAYLERHPFFNSGQKVVLHHAAETFPEHLFRLYRQFPVTVVHNDYFPKNLIVANGRIRVIDWTNAYLSPHLGDLYGLMSEARDYKVDPEELLEAYFLEIGGDESPYDVSTLRWMAHMGGICWLAHTMKWIVEYGRHVIPGSDAWIDDMILELQKLTSS